jgi:membrane protein implicated in regulation of membrane protease activity
MVVVNLFIGISLIVVGLILFGLEFGHPGALLFIPGSVMLVGGFLYLLLPDVLLDSAVGPLIVLLAAVIAGLAEIPYYRWVAPIHKPMTTTSAGLEGELAVVTVPIVPNTLKGKVRVRSEIWSATANAPIPAGTQVRVVRGEGVSVWVEPIPAGGAS